MKKTPWKLLIGSVAFALCSLLAACGMTTPGGVAAGTTPEPNATVGVSGTPGTIHPIATCSAYPLGNPACVPAPSATARAIATALPGAVRVVLNKASYVPGATAIVSIENGLDVGITVTNHQSDCSYVVLEQLLGDWQPIDPCRLMTPTLLVELSAGSVTAQKIGIPDGPNAAGTYRIVLPFVRGGPVYSANFTVR